MPKIKEKTFTKEELAKAIDEAYSLGFKNGRDASLAPPPTLVDLQITSLAKNISDNGKKINKQLTDRHREAVNRHMKEWSKDAENALVELLEAAHQHDADEKCEHGDHGDHK